LHTGQALSRSCSQGTFLSSVKPIFPLKSLRRFSIPPMLSDWQFITDMHCQTIGDCFSKSFSAVFHRLNWATCQHKNFLGNS
jgi:hypothetical protein